VFVYGVHNDKTTPITDHWCTLCAGLVGVWYSLSFEVISIFILRYVLHVCYLCCLSHKPLLSYRELTGHYLYILSCVSLLLWWLFIVLVVKIWYFSFLILVVGRGVLRFWEGWYRKTRSNFWLFSIFCALAGILGVDIIYWWVGFVGSLGSVMYYVWCIFIWF